MLAGMIANARNMTRDDSEKAGEVKSRGTGFQPVVSVFRHILVARGNDQAHFGRMIFTSVSLNLAMISNFPPKATTILRSVVICISG